MSKYKVMNTNEDVPDVFYIYIGLGGNVMKDINYHNYKIDKKLRASGYSLASSGYKTFEFINGDIDYLPYILNPNKDFPTDTSYSFTKTLPYSIEYNLELYRKVNYKKFPSRFSCIYAFGDEETALRNKPKDKKAVLKKFRLLSFRDILVRNNDDSEEYKIFDDAIKVVKCDMGIIKSIYNNQSFLNPDNIPIISDLYWTGKKNELKIELQNLLTGEYEIIEKDSSYEYLIEGILEEIEE